MTIRDTRKGMVSNMTMPGAQQSFSNILQMSAGVVQAFDFKTLANLFQIDNIQGVWIDNSAGQTPFTLSVAATFQNFTVPPGYQGTAPLYVTSDLVVNLSGSGQVPIVFTNFPTPVGVWPATGNVPLPPGGFTFTGGSLNTLDSGLAAKTEAGGLAVMDRVRGPGDVPRYSRQGEVISGQSIIASTTIVAASGVLRPFVTSFTFSMSSSAHPAADGDVTASLNFVGSGRQIWVGQMYMNAAAPTVKGFCMEFVNMTGVDFVGEPGDSLAIGFSTVASGALFYSVGCGLTAGF